MSGTNFYGELVRAQLQNSASDLTPTATGLVYFNTTTGVKWYTGSAWLTAADLTTSQVFTNKDYDGGTASDTSRITLPKASSSTLNALTRKEATLVYDTTTSQVKYDNGTSLLAVGSSSGAGEINAVLNPSVADTTTGWTNGTSHTLTRVTSGSPLDPVISTALSIAATTTATESATSGEYYSIASLASGLRNKKLKIEFYFTTEASQTWAISVWQGATRKSLSTDSSGATTLPAGTTGKFTAYLDTDSSAAYTVNFTRTAGSGTATLLVTSVIFGPGIQPQGAVVGAWQSYTPTFTGFGTVGSVAFAWRQVGENIEVEGRFQCGTSTVVQAAISFPNNYTVATLNGFNGVVRGRWDNLQKGTSNSRKTGTFYFTAGASSPVFVAGEYALTNILSSALNGTDVATGDVMAVSFDFPATQLIGAGTVNLAQNDVEYAYNSSTTDADDTTSFGYGPGGTGFGSYTAARQKTVRFQTPHQESDSYQIEIFDTTAWIPLGTYSNSVLPLTNQGTETYGMTLDNSSTSGTDLVVQFGKYRLTDSGSFGAAGLAWSGLSASFKWRVKKVKGGVAVGFGLADAVNGISGLTVLPYSMIRLNTGNGFGSTNTKIRRFTTTVQTIGSDITYADSSTLGATFTINRAGVYSISFTDRCSAVATVLGVSKNSTQLTTNIDTITAADRLVVQNSQASNTMSGVSVTVVLASGDVIRAHTQGQASSSTAADETLFTITQVARF